MVRFPLPRIEDMIRDRWGVGGLSVGRALVFLTLPKDSPLSPFIAMHANLNQIQIHPHGRDHATSAAHGAQGISVATFPEGRPSMEGALS